MPGDLSDASANKPALAESVVCHGSGRIREELITKYNSPFAIETATFKIKGSDVCAEVTRSLFDTARQYRESFDVTASRRQLRVAAGRERGAGAAHARACRSRRSRGGSRCPTSPGRLPEPIRKFTGAIHDATHLSFLQGAGHGGSHPHLAHNFLMAVPGQAAGLPGRPDERELDAVGICAHQSALKKGDKVQIPEF